jgi:hypothetical protein
MLRAPDAHTNRHAIRMGTAELYRAVEAIPDVILSRRKLLPDSAVR